MGDEESVKLKMLKKEVVGQLGGLRHVVKIIGDALESNPPRYGKALAHISQGLPDSSSLLKKAIQAVGKEIKKIEKEGLRKDSAGGGKTYIMRLSGRVTKTGSGGPKSRCDIDREALKKRLEKRLQVCKDIVKYWGSGDGGFKASGDADQIKADLEAVQNAERFISRAEEVLSKLK